MYLIQQAMCGEIAQKYIRELIVRYPVLKGCARAIADAIAALANSFASGSQLFIAGNGGSAADCEHIVGELMKGFMKKRHLGEDIQNALGKQYPEYAGIYGKHLQQGLPAIALTAHSALFSAYANDEDPDLIYAQQLLGYGRKNDAFLGISTSGNSASICHAFRIARTLGLSTIGLTGQSGGTLQELADIVIAVPESITAYVQELHLPVYHCICLAVEEIFFPC